MAQVSILVADDNAEMRALLAGQLRKHFEVRQVVSNGKQLFAAAVEGEVDAIVTDVYMPVLTGLDVMWALRIVGRVVPFIMVSGSPDIAAKCLASGASAFVAKMDVARELVPAIRAALEGRIYVSAEARAACEVPEAEGKAPRGPQES